MIGKMERLCHSNQVALHSAGNLFLILLTILSPNIFKAAKAPSSTDPYLNTLLILCMTAFLLQWCAWVAVSRDTWRKVFLFDLVIILTIVFDLTWVSDKIGDVVATQILSTIRSLRLLHTVPIFTKLSRRLVDTFNGHETAFVSNIGLKLINSLISVVTCMMILLYMSMILIYRFYHRSSFEGFATSLEHFQGQDMKQPVEAFFLQESCKPLSLEVFGSVVSQWNIIPPRKSLVREIESKNEIIVLNLDISGQRAQLAVVDLVYSLVIIFLVAAFAMISNILLYQSIVRTLERVYLALKRTLALQSSFLRHHRQQQAYTDQMHEIFGDDEVDGDLAKFESMIQSVLRLVTSEVNVQHLFERHPEMNSKAAQLISYLTGSKNDAVSEGCKIKVIARASSHVTESSREMITHAELHTWEFDVLSHSAENLVVVVVSIFEELKCIHPKGISSEEKKTRAFQGLSFVSQDVLENFIVLVSSKYSSQNTYHNFYHCVDVTHATFLIISKIRKRANINSFESFCLLVAALAHDLDHPGVNNAFLIKSRHPLAIRYNDISVLESQHASCFFDLINTYPESNVLRDLTDNAWVEARKLIIHAIIHTDMAKHFPLVSRLEMYGEADPEDSHGSMSSEEDRLFLVAMILHAADISNPARSTSVASEWARRVLNEFFLQGDLERQSGSPISTMCDRSETCINSTQKNFIEFIVAPLYKAMSAVFPELVPMYKNVLQTKEFWTSAI
jgi:high affinity cGMP-specific 3',5'-cyclic phosphodiesterase 9